MPERKTETSFIVYACAGCSRAGQAAYSVALELDKLGTAEMSCLAGIASGKSSFFRKIRNKRIITIDGCPTECSKGVLDKAGIQVDVHIKLKDYGIRKHDAIRGDEVASVVEDVCKRLIPDGE